MARQLPSKELSGILTTVPTSPTAFTSVNSWITLISVANTTAGALTFTVLDKQGTPKTLVPTVSIAANTCVLFKYDVDNPQLMSGGITWSGSGAGLEAGISGFIAG